MLIQNISNIPKFNNNPKKLAQTSSVNLKSQNSGGDVFVRTSPAFWGNPYDDKVALSANQLLYVLQRSKFDSDDYDTCMELLNEYELAGPIKDKDEARDTLYCVLKEYYDWIKRGDQYVSGDRRDLRLKILEKTLDSMVKKGAYHGDIQTRFDYIVYGFSDDQCWDPWDRWEAPLPGELYPKEIKKFFDKANEYRTKEIRKQEEEARKIETEKFIEKLKPFNAEIEDKYNIYDIKNWNSILDEFEKLDKEDYARGIISFTLNNLPDIFLTDENKEEYENVINRLSKVGGDWNMKTEDTGDNLAHRAAVAENPLLIKLANKKGVSFLNTNNLGKTALEYLEEYDSNLEDLKGFKVNCSELTEYATNDKVSILKFILKSPYVDINSVDKDGNNLAIAAAQNSSREVINLLNESEEFDINYRNPETGKNALESAVDSSAVWDLLRNPKIDLNSTDGEKPPFAFQFLSREYGYDIIKKSDDFMKLNALIEANKHVDIQTKYNGQTLAEAIKKYIENLPTKDVDTAHSMTKKLYELLNSALSRDIISQARTIVNKNGTLTLKQINEFLQFPGIKKIIDEPLNDLNESIGFFVADTALTLGNFEEFENIMKILVKNNYNFHSKNKMGQTCYEKAVDADNSIMVDFIRKQR